MYKKLSSKGFTLIELLIVIIIIGILAAISFVAYNGATNKAHEAAAESTLHEVQSKLAEYYADNSSYPAVGASGTDSATNIDNWMASSAGGNNQTLSTTYVSPNYTYAVTPTDCGDTVSSTGTITTGSTACTGYTLTASGSMFGSSTNLTVTN